MPNAPTPATLAALVLLVAASSLLLRPAQRTGPVPGLRARQRDARRLAAFAAIPACVAAPSAHWIAQALPGDPHLAWAMGLALLLGAVLSLALPLRPGSRAGQAPEPRLRLVAALAAAVLGATGACELAASSASGAALATRILAACALPAGYALLMPVFGAMRERFDSADAAPAALRGAPLAWLGAAVLLLALSGLAGTGHAP